MSGRDEMVDIKIGLSEREMKWWTVRKRKRWTFGEREEVVDCQGEMKW